MGGARQRVPTVKEVGRLARDEWEDLCAGLCTEVFQAHRVEDHLGRGNGMDGWRMMPAGVEGFQHRRFDGRFGRDQLDELKKNVNLAASRCPTEHGAKLVAYHVCINIDLQPGHRGTTGEIELWREFEDWARSTHGVAAVLHGVTWVTTRLKQFPYIRPDLFEDIAQALADARQELADKIDENIKATSRVLELVEQLARASAAEARLKQVLVKLAHEARLAFDRAIEHGSEEKFVEAIAKLEDARRLLEVEQVDERLHGHVLLLLCGMKALTGHLTDAVNFGQSALRLLNDPGDEDLARLAHGNIGIALYKLQRYDEASILFEGLLPQYEADGNLVEVVRTLEHLAEMCCNAGNVPRAMMWAERLKTASKALVRLQGGLSDLIVAAQGTYANVLVAMADCVPDPVRGQMLRDAIRTLEGVEQMATMVGSPMTALIARSQLARCAWNLGDYARADAGFQRAIADADAMGLGKNAADARFNRALLLEQQGKTRESEQEFHDARRRYVSLGDLPSVADVDARLARLASD